jgi:hypothetical protein
MPSLPVVAAVYSDQRIVVLEDSRSSVGASEQWGQGIEIGINPWPSLIESRKAARFRRLLQVARSSSPLKMQFRPPTVAVAVQIRSVVGRWANKKPWRWFQGLG